MLGDEFLNIPLDAMFGADLIGTMPAFFWMGLALTPSTSAGYGDEPDSLDGYQRVFIENTGTTFGPAVAGSKSNLITVEFAPATNPWGAIDGWFFVDQGTWGLGNIIIGASFDTPLAVIKGDAPFFPPGTITLQAV